MFLFKDILSIHFRIRKTFAAVYVRLWHLCSALELSKGAPRKLSGRTGRRARSARGRLARDRSARSGKLDRARSRLYRSNILQENMRLKALAEIYTMHSFAQLLESIIEKCGKRTAEE